MFYQYSDELTTIEPQDRDPNLVCAAYITLAELDAHYEKFGFSPSTVQQCKEENRYFRSNIEVYDEYSFGTLKITDAANARAREDCLAFPTAPPRTFPETKWRSQSASNKPSSGRIRITPPSRSVSCTTSGIAGISTVFPVSSLISYTSLAPVCITSDSLP